jgi:hypothetical protein
MKKIIYISMVILLVFSALLYLGTREATNSLEVIDRVITEKDEKVILEYLNAKTDDINAARESKMYSAFVILGNSKDRIYIWLLKEECSNYGDYIDEGNGVSLPVVLYIKEGSNGIEIKKHKYPEDGERYGRSMKKLFPKVVLQKIDREYNEIMATLKEKIVEQVRNE